MTELPALWLKATAASVASVAAAISAQNPALPPVAVSFLLGSGGLALIAAVFAYGKLAGRVEMQAEQLRRIEAKLDAALPQLAVVADRTEGQ